MKMHAPERLECVTRTRGQRTERLFWMSGRGYDRNDADLTELENMIQYIHANPVRRGLADLPTEWAWSSARWYEQGIEGPILIDPVDS